MPLANEDGEYLVDKIVGTRRRGKRLLYEVQWLGWPEDYTTLEPYEHIKHTEALAV